MKKNEYGVFIRSRIILVYELDFEYNIWGIIVVLIKLGVGEGVEDVLYLRGGINVGYI